MKLLMLMLTLGAFQAHAAEVCETVWAYKPWKTCSDARNGLDQSQAKPVSTKTLSTSPVAGGSNADKECAKLGNTLSIDMPNHALRAEKVSSSEKSDKDLLGHVTYVYTCNFRVSEVPYKTKGPACGTEDKLQFQTKGNDLAIDGKALCISCDDRNKQDEIVSCLLTAKNNWTEISASGVVRRDDKEAVLKRVNQMLRFERATSFMAVDDKTKILDFQEQLQNELKQ